LNRQLGDYSIGGTLELQRVFRWSAQMVSRTIQWHSGFPSIFAFSVILVGLVGCRTPQPSPSAGSMPLFLDESRMQTEVLQHVEIGMLVAEAKKVMERHGFDCRIDEKSKDFTPDFNSPTHLRCVRIRPQDNPAHQGIVLDEICVYMPIEADKIKAVKVRHIRTSM
jgi:hypothetical protein